MNAEADRHFRPIEDALNVYLGYSALYEIVLPWDGLQGRRLSEISVIQQAIIAWFKETASTVPSVPVFETAGPSIGPVTVSGVPFPIALYHYEPTATSKRRVSVFTVALQTSRALPMLGIIDT